MDCDSGGFLPSGGSVTGSSVLSFGHSKSDVFSDDDDYDDDDRMIQWSYCVI